MDYAALIDDDVAAFIRKTESFAVSANSIEDQRQHFNAVCAHFARPHPPEITCQDKVINGVPSRHYLPADPKDARIVYFHGGGFVVGNLGSHDDSICADLAAATGMELIAVDYRLAPEHRHPAALEDGLAVRDAVLAEAPDRPLLLLGDSAGGWLAAMVAAENPSRVAGQVLIYPMTGAPMDAESYIVHGQAPLLSSEAIAWYWAQYFGAAPEETIAPLAYEDLSTSRRHGSSPPGLTRCLMTAGSMRKNCGMPVSMYLVISPGIAAWVPAGSSHDRCRRQHGSGLSLPAAPS